MASAKEFKIVLAGQFGTGKTTFATRVRLAKSDKKETKALRTTQYPVKLTTSGQVTLNLFDTDLHTKGGLSDDGFFRTADAAIVFLDLTKEDSYTAMEDWYDAVVKANGRRGSEPLPVVVVVVGTKADDIWGRELKPEAIEFPRKKEHPYREISSDANYGVKELLLDVCKALLGDSVQLTDEVDLDKPKIDKIDEEQFEKLFSEYEKAASN
ncbi:related to GSP1-GTP-binding protein of the ras superfamily [Sporisorium scitamineum]|uniref:Related to GSP1-GTP-binding protein of the ras superfamily n=1 Tax=Sporisorium scitamineum TaxID=49012 RepID=A0A127ZB13_9BASI|nr:related to GSP1-GTP-binding protein of the ras superfamily [Sporisorium scitamineum]